MLVKGMRGASLFSPSLDELVANFDRKNRPGMKLIQRIGWSFDHLQERRVGDVFGV
ncbi:hypothetical protein PPSIR1_11015 [Plesiocystis pacifica SIR-1]|uniref:Uncharacterized protein n=1 Tax=Plesiocystis pacifica SIR-1 TaxID=391625 RepID=A6GH62_9BACT|nr:hypothetical protein PPSIR1_11015 [Plesiocystis pacifica SIR-1]